VPLGHLLGGRVKVGKELDGETVGRGVVLNGYIGQKRRGLKVLLGGQGLSEKGKG